MTRRYLSHDIFTELQWPQQWPRVRATTAVQWIWQEAEDRQTDRRTERERERESCDSVESGVDWNRSSSVTRLDQRGDRLRASTRSAAQTSYEIPQLTLGGCCTVAIDDWHPSPLNSRLLYCSFTTLYSFHVIHYCHIDLSATCT